MFRYAPNSPEMRKASVFLIPGEFLCQLKLTRIPALRLAGASLEKEEKIVSNLVICQEENEKDFPRKG